MPRFSEEQRKKLKAQLESDDDDDDDLLKPSLLHPSNRSASQPSPQISKESEEKKEDEPTKVWTEQELKEQGMFLFSRCRTVYYVCPHSGIFLSQQ